MTRVPRAPASREGILAKQHIVDQCRREERREVVSALRDVMHSLPTARQRDDAVGRAFRRAGTEIQEHLVGILDDTREAERSGVLHVMDGIEFLNRVIDGLAAAREEFVQMGLDRDNPGSLNAVAQANALHYVTGELRRIGPDRVAAVLDPPNAMSPDGGVA